MIIKKWIKTIHLVFIFAILILVFSTCFFYLDYIKFPNQPTKEYYSFSNKEKYAEHFIGKKHEIELKKEDEWILEVDSQKIGNLSFFISDMRLKEHDNLLKDFYYIILLCEE